MGRDTRTGGVLEAMVLPALKRGGYAHQTQVVIGKRLQDIYAAYIRVPYSCSVSSCMIPARSSSKSLRRFCSSSRSECPYPQSLRSSKPAENKNAPLIRCQASCQLVKYVQIGLPGIPSSKRNARENPKRIIRMIVGNSIKSVSHLIGLSQS